MKPGLLLIILGHFAAISLVAVGGATAVVPEIHRQAVEIGHWMTDQQFADLFAIAQAAPGPNVVFVALVGWQAAGFPGALIAMIGMCTPSSILTFTVFRLWHRFKDRPWRQRVQDGLAPVTVGLIGASAFLLARAADINIWAALLTAASAVLTYGTRLNPLWLLGGGAVLGVALLS
jgi:chromate transporter